MELLREFLTVRHRLIDIVYLKFQHLLMLTNYSTIYENCCTDWFCWVQIDFGLIVLSQGQKAGNCGRQQGRPERGQLSWSPCLAGRLSVRQHVCFCFRSLPPPSPPLALSLSPRRCSLQAPAAGPHSCSHHHTGR